MLGGGGGANFPLAGFGGVGAAESPATPKDPEESGEKFGTPGGAIFPVPGSELGTVGTVNEPASGAAGFDLPDFGFFVCANSSFLAAARSSVTRSPIPGVCNMSLTRLWYA